MSVKPPRSELGRVMTRTDPDPFDEWEQTKLVRFSERSGPKVFSQGDIVIDREGVMEMGDSSNVPRVACQGTRQEGGGIVDEVGNDDLYKFLRKLGDWRPACGRRIRGTSTEQPLDFGHAAVS